MVTARYSMHYRLICPDARKSLGIARLFLSIR